MTAEIQQKIGAKNRSFALKLLGIPLAMFGFAYALVPLYDVLCDITGLNGTTGTITAEESIEYAIDESREISVTFFSTVAPGMPLNFEPKVKKMLVTPGKTQTMIYIAENRSDQVVYGQAVPSVAPTEGALNFKKIECFCFTQQRFEPRVPVEMPVTFVIDPALNESVKDISLSYSFFRIDPPKG